MENNKYYTPTLKEFNIGFEYEIHALPGDEWVNVKLTKDNFYLNMDRVLNHIDQCRVKYLDQSDIESLGWKFENTKNSFFTKKNLNTYKIVKESGFNTGTTYTLEQLDNNLYLIKSETYSSYGSEVCQMSFIIFNKSELIKLMQQLNIK